MLYRFSSVPLTILIFLDADSWVEYNLKLCSGIDVKL